jgi:hypothetical protein
MSNTASPYKCRRVRSGSPTPFSTDSPTPFSTDSPTPFSTDSPKVVSVSFFVDDGMTFTIDSSLVMAMKGLVCYFQMSLVEVDGEPSLDFYWICAGQPDDDDNDDGDVGCTLLFLGC